MTEPAPRYNTLEDVIGNTPLVRLLRIPGADNEARGNVILGKLEGNNPAGSVKDRPAISMIRRAEERGTIKPGDTLIEATSGNTGIALAMAAAIRGYRMLLIMPEDLSIERAQTMQRLRRRTDADAALGRHGVRARPRAADAEGRQGHGARPVRQRGQPAHPLRDHRPRDLARHGRPGDALRQCDGHDRHHHRHVALPQGKEPRRSASSARSRPRARASRASASGRRSTCRRSTTRPGSTRWST